MFDVVLKKATIYDGQSDAPYESDIGIVGDTIHTIANLDAAEAREVLPVDGLAVSPGFIDLHTHSDFTLIADGRAESQVHQGVTTEVVGQCGVSCAPACDNAAIQNMAFGFAEGCHPLGWRSFGDYLDTLEEIDLGVNVIAFVGHGAVHQAVLGDALRAANDAEVDVMTRLVEESLDEGASGFSTGLEYWPGSLAALEHLVPLCSAAAERGKLYATHVRNRDSHYDLGFTEALATARLSGARLQISHIQPKYGAPAHAMEHTLELIDMAKRQGVDVAFDVIPHNWNHTRVRAILPKWALEGGPEAIVKRLRDPKMRSLIRKNRQPMWLLVRDAKWSEIVLLDADVNKDLIGASFEEIGRIRGVDPYDAVFDLLIEEAHNMSRLLWTSSAFKESDIELALSQPECAVISDTAALAPNGVLKDHIGSLSGYGWAAQFLQRYVSERKVLGLANALQRITSVPADRLGLKDRGRLMEGKKADICVFDPTTMMSHCTVQNPRAFATGIEHVLVNGQFAMKNGARQNSNAGCVLREVRCDH
ncbi:MAG: amidohydrolase family protein [Rhodobacteraceae bacterium]|nr:amidohydrolase family protein [Paracoccaceae bacterium]